MEIQGTCIILEKYRFMWCKMINILLLRTLVSLENVTYSKMVLILIYTCFDLSFIIMIENATKS